MNSFFSSPLFETIICLILVFALICLLASNLLELINAYVQERGTMLYRSISGMFEDAGNVNFGQLLYNVPAIDNLKKNKDSLPQYISKEMFANGIIDVISNYAREYEYSKMAGRIEMIKDTGTLFDRFEAGVEKMLNTPLKLQLLNLIDRAKGMETANVDSRLVNLQEQLQQWFEDQMERTTGWYKAKLRTRLFIIGIVVAVALNIDSIHLFQSFYRLPYLRGQLVPVAEKLADSYASAQRDTTLTKMQQMKLATDSIRHILAGNHYDSNSVAAINQSLAGIDKIDSTLGVAKSHAIDSLEQNVRSSADVIAGLGIPIGWFKTRAPLSWFYHQEEPPKDYFERYKRFNFWNLISYLLGIFITAFSIQFGAPFWFDLLLKAVNVRRAGRKPGEQQ